MKIPLFCTQCDQGTISMVMVEPRQDGRYSATCPNGHRISRWLQLFNFEILFEIGANAILDGYYREAVVSFHTSYERFLEFYCRVVARSAGIERPEFEKNWKFMANKSERQIGAFAFAWLMTERCSPTILSEKQSNFRNQVVHQGRIPARDEAVEYGQTVLDLVRPVVRLLREHHWPSFAEELRALNPGMDWNNLQAMPTILGAGISASPPIAENLQDYVKRISRFRVPTRPA